MKTVLINQNNTQVARDIVKSLPSAVVNGQVEDM